MSLKEKELDARLQKIERDNTTLLTMLSGIASSFGDLNKILPRDQQRREGRLWLGMGDKVEEGLETPSLAPTRVQKRRSLEPVMQELQGAAGRVGSERSTRMAELEFDELEENHRRLVS